VCGQLLPRPVVGKLGSARLDQQPEKARSQPGSLGAAHSRLPKGSGAPSVSLGEGAWRGSDERSRRPPGRGGGAHPAGPNGRGGVRVTTRVGVDPGGPFPDVVTASGEAVKLLSTPADPAQAVATGVARGGGAATLAHGTTVATNALLERRGGRVALLTSEGQ